MLMLSQQKSWLLLAAKKDHESFIKPVDLPEIASAAALPFAGSTQI